MTTSPSLLATVPANLAPAYGPAEAFEACLPAITAWLERTKDAQPADHSGSVVTPSALPGSRAAGRVLPTVPHTAAPSSHTRPAALFPAKARR
jgi:hypothetical protein